MLPQCRILASQCCINAGQCETMLGNVSHCSIARHACQCRIVCRGTPPGLVDTKAIPSSKDHIPLGDEGTPMPLIRLTFPEEV